MELKEFRFDNGIVSLEFDWGNVSFSAREEGPHTYYTSEFDKLVETLRKNGNFVPEYQLLFVRTEKDGDVSLVCSSTGQVLFAMICPDWKDKCYAIYPEG